MARQERPCRRCGGGGVICNEVRDTTMRCPDPSYDDEHDLLGVCPHRVPCPECELTRRGPGGHWQVVVCPTCDGTGEVHSHNPLCPTCRGRRFVPSDVAATAPRS